MMVLKKRCDFEPEIDEQLRRISPHRGNYEPVIRELLHCKDNRLLMTQPSPPKPLVSNESRFPLKISQWAGYSAAVGLSIALAATNPTQPTYTEFATQTVSRLLVQDLCRANERTPKLFDTMIKDGCQAFMHQGKTEIRAFIAHNTERQNFLLFSLYTTEFPIRPLRVLGIFNHFFLIS
jgi:hypothetical protein